MPKRKQKRDRRHNMIQTTSCNPAALNFYCSLAKGCGGAFPAITSAKREWINAAAFIQDLQ